MTMDDNDCELIQIQEVHSLFGMNNLQTYLASKYMSGPKADAILGRTAQKKKKRKPNEHQTPVESSMIVDEDGGWGNGLKEQEEQDGIEDVEDVIVASDRSFKKLNGGHDSGWVTVKEPSPPPGRDEQPIVVPTEEESTFKGGLVTAAQLRKQRASKPAPVKEEQPPEEEQETVYRDASGRRIDTKAERAEAARKKREKEELEAKKMEWGKGLIQKEDEERKRAELAAESMKDLARYADDIEMNERMKAEERWNDPAAAFLSKNKKSKGPRRPEYNGPPPPPNRFGIKPGYRWDGVDRSNGFERKYFQKINERSRTSAASHQWSVEDM